MEQLIFHVAHWPRAKEEIMTATSASLLQNIISVNININQSGGTSLFAMHLS